jgi:hypothetical protein
MTEKTLDMLMNNKSRMQPKPERQNEVKVVKLSDDVMEDSNFDLDESPKCVVCNVTKNDSIHCAFCNKTACPTCVVDCEKCSNTFCTFCSVTNYDQRFDRNFCISCNQEEIQRARQAKAQQQIQFVNKENVVNGKLIV